jgi:polyisoprenoid-binding protein YceI
MNFQTIKYFISISFILWLFVLAIPPQKAQSKFSESLYKIDTAKSIIHWNCHHRGIMKFKSGNILLINREPSEIDLHIDMNSITNSDIDNKLLQGTLVNVLKSIEFFNTEKYPESRFESHQITKIDENHYNFEGDFIIFEAGICSNFKGSIKFINDSLHFNTETITLDRTNWGLYYVSANNPYPKDEEGGFVVTDTILLDAHIIAYKK